MQRSNGARLMPLIIILIVVALAIAAIVSIGRAVFNSGGSDTPAIVQNVGRESLLKTDLGRSVSMTVRGPIVANEAFKSYQILVSPDERKMSIYTGYLENRTGGKTLGNNTAAYEEFVYALDKAEMTRGDSSKEISDDLRGICATGYVYEFAVLNDDQSVSRLWTSTCDGSKGTLDASKEQVGDLFINQIPNGRDMIPFARAPILSF